MANPLIVLCNEGVWTKVASSATVGMLWLNVWSTGESKKAHISYFQTYRMAGDVAPSDSSERVWVPAGGIPISSVDPIDVYIYCLGGTGSVRVDLK
jgi:hypothetical protein